VLTGSVWSNASAALADDGTGLLADQTMSTPRTTTIGPPIAIHFMFWSSQERWARGIRQVAPAVHAASLVAADEEAGSLAVTAGRGGSGTLAL